MSETPLTLIQPKVIDPDDQAEMERFSRLHDEAWKRVMDRHPDRVGTPSWEIVAEQFRLFRDPTYRVKPDEPLGLGAVVEDVDYTRWTRVESGEAETRNPWYPAHDPSLQPAEWTEIVAVRVLSEGVRP